MKLSPIQLRILAKTNPQMALVQFMQDMREEHKAEMERMKEQFLTEAQKEMQTEIQTQFDSLREEIKGLIPKNDAMEAVMQKIQMLKGEKGDKPKAGEDFPTHDQLVSFIKEQMPKKGEHYFTEQETDDMTRHITSVVQSRIVIPIPKDGRTPIRGVDYPSEVQIARLILEEVEKRPKYSEIELMSKLIPKLTALFPKLELKGEDIVNKINALPIEPQFQIDAKHIKNLPKATRERVMLGGSGKGAGLGTSALLTVTGTIDDSNLTFTVTEEPAVLLINGGMYRRTAGAITWTYSGGTITLSEPVGSNGAIYGIR